MEAVGAFWARVTATVPDLPTTVLVATAAVAAVLVLSPALWRPARNVVTIAHEGGHALTAVLAGRGLTGIRLHPDTSGLTVSTGARRGPGLVFTFLGGYPAPLTDQDPYGAQMGPCNFCGFCSGYACYMYSKASPNVNILPALRQEPKFELRNNSYVLRVNLSDDKKRATGVTYVDGQGRGDGDAVENHA